MAIRNTPTLGSKIKKLFLTQKFKKLFYSHHHLRRKPYLLSIYPKQQSQITLDSPTTKTPISKWLISYQPIHNSNFILPSIHASVLKPNSNWKKVKFNQENSKFIFASSLFKNTLKMKLFSILVSTALAQDYFEDNFGVSRTEIFGDEGKVFLRKFWDK